MICMLSKVNVGVGEMGLMFCDLHVSIKKPFAGINKFDKISLYASCLPGDASNLRYFS